MSELNTPVPLFSDIMPSGDTAVPLGTVFEDLYGEAVGAKREEGGGVGAPASSGRKPTCPVSAAADSTLSPDNCPITWSDAMASGFSPAVSR